MSIRRKVIALYAAAALAACSFDAVNFTLENPPGDGPLVENCAIPGDEDGNGLADCDDPACAGAPGCQARCGNRKLESGEACDDGNTVDGDGCSADCKSTEICGNGIVDTAVGEVCDPPAPGTCGADCRSLLACGNGVLDPGEECDDGLANNGDNKDCRSDCVINRCGDGRVNTSGTHHEDCDGAPITPDHIRTAVPTETATCNSDCTAPRCGDGKVNGHFRPVGTVVTEQCDNGAANAANADCTADCQISVCGDGHLNTVGPLRKEGCDDGNRVDTDNCTNACVARSCGDGIVGPGEECDLGAANSDTGACLSNCRLATCGDGKVRAGVEECDGTPGCSATCHLQQCGNGVVDPGEECDDGLANNGDNKDCRSDCVINRCGDGHVNTSGIHREECDGGPVAASHDRTAIPTETATCNSDCTAPLCGDGKVNSHFRPAGALGPEQCDNGAGANADNADCTASCLISMCGDGHLNSVGPLRKEGCDDGNTVNGDGCESDCTLSVCGNGIVDPGEVCDDGNTLACGSCSANCLTVTSSPATGLIFAAPGNAYAAGDNFVLSDGIAAAVTFEFTNGTPAPGHVAIRFTVNDTAQTVATAIANAVLASGLKLTAQAVNGVVLLQHQRPTSRGNIAISKLVASPAFAVFGMAGGKGGDCPTNTGCADDDDCTSHVCAFGRCQ